MRRKLFVCLAVVAASAAAFGALAPAQPSQAAPAPSQQWITAVTAPSTAPATITWGTSGLTATLGAGPSGGASCAGTNVASNADLNSYNATGYYSSTPPSNAIGIVGCLRHTFIARQVVLSKPVLSPIFHINNLDASNLEFLPGSSGGTIALEKVSGNVQSQFGATNNILQPASGVGYNGCTVPDPALPSSTENNSTCGSYRMTENGGAVKSFLLRNVQRISGADGFMWSISFPTSTLTKTFSPSTVRLGEAVTATFTMSNPAEPAAVPLSGLSFTDALPTGMTLADGALTTNGQCGTPALNGGTAAAGDATVAVTAVDLAVGADCEVKVAVKTSTTGSFTNTASNLTTGFANLIPSGTTTLTVLAQAAPSLTILKSRLLTDANNNGAADAGEKVAYSFAVTNTGNVDLAEVAVNDPSLTALGVSITPASATVAAGGNQTFTADYTVTQADVDAGELNNTATAEGVYVQSGGARVPVASLPSSVTIPVAAQTPAVSLTKTGVLTDKDGDSLADPGETVTFSFVVTNTGNVTLTGVTLADPMLGAATPAPTATLAPGATVQFSVPHEVRDSDITGGTVVNKATVTAASPGATTVSATDTVTLGAQKSSPALAFTGTSLAATAAAALLLLTAGAVLTLRRRRAS